MDEEIEGLKMAINNILWMHLPGSITLKQADEIACRWFSEVTDLRRKAKFDEDFSTRGAAADRSVKGSGE